MSAMAEAPLFSTIIMFAIIQGLYLLREDEEEDIERKKKERLLAEGSRQKIEAKRRAPANVKEEEQKEAHRETSAANRKSAQETKISLELHLLSDCSL